MVAIWYPIHETIPKTPPTTINMVNCKTIGLHSESIKSHAYTKNAAMQETKMKTPIDFRLDMSIRTKTVI